MDGGEGVSQQDWALGIQRLIKVVAISDPHPISQERKSYRQTSIILCSGAELEVSTGVRGAQGLLDE